VRGAAHGGFYVPQPSVATLRNCYRQHCVRHGIVSCGGGGDGGITNFTRSSLCSDRFKTEIVVATGSVRSTTQWLTSEHTLPLCRPAASSCRPTTPVRLSVGSFSVAPRRRPAAYVLLSTLSRMLFIRFWAVWLLHANCHIIYTVTDFDSFVSIDKTKILSDARCLLCVFFRRHLPLLATTSVHRPKYRNTKH